MYRAAQSILLLLRNQSVCSAGRYLFSQQSVTGDEMTGALTGEVTGEPKPVLTGKLTGVTVLALLLERLPLTCLATPGASHGSQDSGCKSSSRTINWQPLDL